MKLRRALLIIGLLALLAVSVFSTLYLVNHPRRKGDGRVLRVGVTDAREVLSPTELLSPPEKRQGKSVSPEAMNAPRPAVTRPDGYLLTYPEWVPGPARVEAAKAVTAADNFIKPMWSPVGLDIALTREASGGLYLASPSSGAPPRLLSPDAVLDELCQWTPDGMSIKAPGADGLYSEYLITGERFPIPDPDEVVFERDDRIFYRNEDGQEKQISGLEDRFTEPLLSPDGLKVVYRGRETGLYIGLADGSRVIFVGEGRNARWVPDSRAIVYDLPVSDGHTVVDGDLWLATVDGRTRTNITNTPGIVETHPSVSPDGRKIAFSAGGAIYVGQLLRQEP